MSLRTTITDLTEQRTNRVIEFLGTYPKLKTELMYSRFLIGLAESEVAIHRAVLAASLAEGNMEKWSDAATTTEMFTFSVRDKFASQIGRHTKTPENARWMLRNPPAVALTDKDKAELKTAINGPFEEKHNA